MSKVKDRQTIHEMARTIDRYSSGHADLMILVQTLELGTRSLDSVSNDWKKRIFEEWIELEIIYSTLLERDGLKTVPTNEEAIKIDSILISIKKILNEINETFEMHFCPSCGADLSDSPVWFSKKNLNDSCYCCGFGFGRQPPIPHEVKVARDRWLLHPEFWKEPSARPDNWKIENQMDNIPGAYL